MRQVVKAENGQFVVQNFVHLHMNDDGAICGAEWQDESIHNFSIFAKLAAWWRDAQEESNRPANEWDDQ